jgi:hypothetical protein
VIFFEFVGARDKRLGRTKSELLFGQHGAGFRPSP